MDLGLQGKAAFVTGGSMGIGREVARHLLRDHVENNLGRVLLCDQRRDAAQRTFFLEAGPQHALEALVLHLEGCAGAIRPVDSSLVHTADPPTEPNGPGNASGRTGPTTALRAT